MFKFPPKKTLPKVTAPHPQAWLCFFVSTPTHSPPEQKAAVCASLPPPPTQFPRPVQKTVKCSRLDGRRLLNFELISALIRSRYLIQSTWIMQWMLFLIFVNIAPRSLWRLSITQQNIINWRQKLQKNWAKWKDLPQWKKGRTVECYLWISFPLFVMVIPIYWEFD